MEIYSTNPVQQPIIDGILNGIKGQYEDHFGLLDGDDSYDFANYIAALDKARAVLVKKLEEYKQFQGHQESVDEMIKAANADWAGWREISN